MDWGGIIENTFRGLIGEQFIYFGLAAIGLNMHFGYTGLLNFGQAVFMAAGAYGLSMAVATLGLNFWWGLLLGIVVFPLILAAIMGVPTLRLRADYLAIVTIAASEMFRIIARSPSLDRWTGSSDGLTAFARLSTSSVPTTLRSGISSGCSSATRCGWSPLAGSCSLWWSVRCTS